MLCLSGGLGTVSSSPARLGDLRGLHRPVPLCVYVRESHSEPEREGVEGLSLSLQISGRLSGCGPQEGSMCVTMSPCFGAGMVDSVRLFLTLRVPVKAGGAQVLLHVTVAGECHTLCKRVCVCERAVAGC